MVVFFIFFLLVFLRLPSLLSVLPELIEDLPSRTFRGEIEYDRFYYSCFLIIIRQAAIATMFCYTGELKSCRP